MTVTAVAAMTVWLLYHCALTGRPPYEIGGSHALGDTQTGRTWYRLPLMVTSVDHRLCAYWTWAP